MTTDNIRLDVMLFKDFVGDDTHRQDSRLRVSRQLEVLCRTLKAHILDGIAQSFVSLSKQLLRNIILFTEVLAHTNGLSTLTREYECKLIQCELPPIIYNPAGWC